MAGAAFPLPGRLRAQIGIALQKIGGYRAALTSMNSSGLTLQAPGEEAFQVAPSA